MKKILFSLGMLVCVVGSNITPIFAQWSVVGKQGLSDGGTSFNRLAIDRNNIPYIAYVDLASNGKITVKSYDGTNWTTVGAQAFSASKVKDVCIAMSSNNTPFVAYSDLSYGHKAVVQRFDGNNWQLVGVPGFSAGRADYLSFAIDVHDVPYVAFSDAGNDKKLTVMKYNGTDWVTVGHAAISWGEAIAVNMAVDKVGIPYVIFKDLGNNSLTRVMKYADNAWAQVGVAGLGYGIHADQSAIAIDAMDIPYVTYATENAREARLLKYENNHWGIAGTPGFATGAVQQPLLATTKNGDVYMAYTDAGLDGELQLLQYTNGGLSTINITGAVNKGDYPSIAIDNNGDPYISFRDYSNGPDAKATLLQYNISRTTNLAETSNNNKLNIYPNPANKFLTINSTDHINEIVVYDVTGKFVINKTTTKQSKLVTIDITALPNGMYLLKAASGDNNVVLTSSFQKQ